MRCLKCLGILPLGHPFVLVALAVPVALLGWSPVVQCDQIHLDAPNGGEMWYTNTIHEIRWSGELVPGIEIFYGNSSTATWIEVPGPVDGTSGVYSWLVPEWPDGQCEVRVVAPPIAGPNEDISDAPFTILADPFRLTAPNGGEVWAARDSHDIEWVGAPSQPIDYIALSYSTDSGGSWTSIVDSTADDGTFAWTVPNDPSTACRVRIKGHYSGGEDVDTSDADFIINVAPEPVLLSLTDVGNDQGGQLRLRWAGSFWDAPGDTVDITGYQVYRREDQFAGLSLLSPASAPGRSIDMKGSQLAGWDFVASVPARGDSLYQYVAPTLCDSTDQGICWSVFMVSAVTDEPLVYFDSEPDSGYSVDNLAPFMPQNFTVAYNTGSGNQLVWSNNLETDLQYYRIYRSSDPNFEPGQGNYVDGSTTPNWTDPDYDGGWVYYKISAVDYSGNESDHASPETTTAVPEPVIPKTFALYQNVPNPVNPTTTIRYDVARGGGAVTLQIFDVSGRLVRTLVDATQREGQKRATWDGRNNAGHRVATGTYFYRLSAPGFTQTKKMMLLK